MLDTDPGGLPNVSRQQYTKQHVWHSVWYATDGIVHCGDRFIGLMKTTFFCICLMEERVCGDNQMPHMSPATSRKPFHLCWFCDGVGCVSYDYKLIWSEGHPASWKPLSFLTLTTMLWPRDQYLWPTMLYLIKRVQ